MKIELSKDWCLNMARQEGDAAIGAGSLARGPAAGCQNTEQADACGEPWHVEYGVPYCTTCGIYRAAVHTRMNRSK